MFNGLYNPQSSIERINNQIAELERMKSQIPQPAIQQPTNLTQNFQLAPSSNVSMRFANSIDDVKKEIVINETPFFSKDMSVLWLKNPKGEVKSYSLEEIIVKDEKDLKIDFLQAQIEELRKEMKTNESRTDFDEPIADATEIEESPIVSRISKNKGKSK